MSRATKPHEIIERALELSRADGTVVIADENSTANLRWAGNALTTNGLTRGRTLTVIASVNGKDGRQQGTASGVVSRSAVTADDLEPLVRAAEEAAREGSPAEDAQPLVAGLPHSPGFSEAPAETGSEVFGSFAPELGETFAQAKSAGHQLYGFASHSMTSTYIGSSTGLRLRHDQPNGTLEINAKNPERTKSAWAGRSTRDFTDVSPAELNAELAQRLRWEERRIDLPAGRYETLLPPTAVADLLIYLYWSASARDAAEGRTVFSTPGGGTKLGARLAELPLTLRSDPAEPGLECAPFVIAHASGGDTSVFDNGLPLSATDWVRNGELTHLATNRFTADLTGMPVTPDIDNLILDAGGTKSLEEMVAGTERGLLLTCLWYIREVDPATLLLTGLTRDGVYLVENGEVTGAVNNFRFNESPVDLLSRASEAGRTEPTLPREWGDYFTRAAMPALRVPDFNMSSVSQGV